MGNNTGGNEGECNVGEWNTGEIWEMLARDCLDN